VRRRRKYRLEPGNRGISAKQSDIEDLAEGNAESIGPYPHSSLRPPRAKTTPAGSRLLRVQCAQCGFLARITRVWLDVAIPGCPNPGCDAEGEPMIVQWRTSSRETPPPKPEFER
jgi:hypothetical protein